MPSFAKTIIFTVAAAVASASPLTFTPGAPVVAPAGAPGNNLKQRDVAVCWGKDAKGTDSYGGPWPARCTKAHYENSFTAPFVMFKSDAADMSIYTQDHITLGPWHCCYSCNESDGCIGWQINADCTCTNWYWDGDKSALGVYGGPFQNQTGTFHRGPAFPAAPNPFGDDTIA